MYVKEFGEWVEGKWIWVVHLRRNVFDWEKSVWVEFLDCLEKVKMGLIAEDCLRWNPASSGMYSAKEFIKFVMTNDESNAEVWKLVWTGLIPPKVETLVWQCMWGRLPARVELMRRKIKGVSSPLCPLCLISSEIVDHLFFSCKVSWYIWSKFCAIWNIYSVLPRTAKSFLVCWVGLSPSTQLNEFWLLVFGAILWSLWLFRNDIVFKRKILDCRQLFDLIMIRIGLWVKAKWPEFLVSVDDFIRCPREALCGKKVKGRSEGGKREDRVISGYSFFVDAARNMSSGVAGIGGVLKGGKGESLVSFCKNVGMLDITTAELIAIKEAFVTLNKSKWANEQVNVLSDCENVVNWFSSPSLAPGGIKETIQECMKTGFGKKWRVAYVPRRLNGEADRLAKEGINRGDTFDPG